MNTFDQTVKVWSDGWHDAHANIVPTELTHLRTVASFHERLRINIDLTRIALEKDEVIGLSIVKNDELYQMYVSPRVQGRGLAQLLMTDAEEQLRRSGCTKAWLACAVGNQRAARFYEKSGWTISNTETVKLDTSQGA